MRRVLPKNALDVPEDQHEPLAGRQRVDRLLELLARLPAEEPVIWSLALIRCRVCNTGDSGREAGKSRRRTSHWGSAVTRPRREEIEA